MGWLFFHLLLKTLKRVMYFLIFLFICGSKTIFSVSQKDTVKIMNDVAYLRYLPPKHCHCNQKIALLRSYSITFLVSKIQLLLTYVLELLYFLQHFPAKHSMPLQPKKIQKKPSQKRRILIDILKKAFNPAYVELELVPFYFWVFEKNPFSKKT